MIGIVNSALLNYARESLGPDAWARLAIGLAPAAFVHTEDYDDRLTFDLADAIAHEAGLDRKTVLERGGEHFGRDVAARDFGVLIRHGSATYRDFLLGLTDLQTRFALIFPTVEGPRFAVEESGPDSVTIKHFAPRSGFGPIVSGMLVGLASTFDVEARVESAVLPADEGSGYMYRVEWRPACDRATPRGGCRGDTTPDCACAGA